MPSTNLLTQQYILVNDGQKTSGMELWRSQLKNCNSLSEEQVLCLKIFPQANAINRNRVACI